MRKLFGMSEYPDIEAARDFDNKSMVYCLGYIGDLVEAHHSLSLMSANFGTPQAAFENMAILGVIADPTSPECQNAHAGFRPVPRVATVSPEDVAKMAMHSSKAPSKQRLQLHPKSFAAASEAAQKVLAADPEIFAPSPYLNSTPDIKLHTTQRAIIEDLRRPLELIHGPPGTGKSTAIRALVRERLPCDGDDMILICATQNKAVDVLVKMFRPYVDNDFDNSAIGMMVVGASVSADGDPLSCHVVLKTELVVCHLGIS
jgi:hypothetical protein